MSGGRDDPEAEETIGLPIRPDWPARIDAALTRLRAESDDRREAELEDEAPRLVDHAPDGFLAWAHGDPFWALVVAESATMVCAKPREAAVFVAREGLRQQLVDEGLLDDD